VVDLVTALDAIHPEPVAPQAALYNLDLWSTAVPLLLILSGDSLQLLSMFPYASHGQLGIRAEFAKVK